MNYELKLHGMSCGHCVRAAQDALESVDGISVLSVEIGRAVIDTEDINSKIEQIRSCLSDEGFPLSSSERLED